ncbi:hypothetical protein [Tissierella creatinophila]|uniref:Uncharacterized protein n=1 Tax=Tissierella creatinophila DSM 6911 TaxID=1123403 RepID=A0A1U7M4L9_TISCR|nr:hypothetical protein [Tissierella creatinophila]OLS02257.1 hypothetical protein TICRE_16430 [Tissierella creatinophila DSM 6911]
MEAEYNAKVRKIIEMLKFQTRDEVSDELGYKNYKSLDMYMRRRNFRYDVEANQYVPQQNKANKLDRDPKSYAPTKVVSIINAFDEENPDPRVISKQEGFKDHKEMAEYMTTKGYEWNAYKANYIKTVGKIEEEETIDKEIENTIPKLINSPTDIDEYIPFIRFLYEKRDDIYQLLSGTKEDGKLPRYIVPGLVRTKAIYMSDMVAKLAAEFSKENNVTQRDVMEGALIEYLQKYGFKKEIETLLKNE